MHKSHSGPNSVFGFASAFPKIAQELFPDRELAPLGSELIWFGIAHAQKEELYISLLPIGTDRMVMVTSYSDPRPRERERLAVWTLKTWGSLWKLTSLPLTPEHAQADQAEAYHRGD